MSLVEKRAVLRGGEVDALDRKLLLLTKEKGVIDFDS